MGFAEYQGIKAINWSSLKHLVFGSPLHYRHNIQDPSPDSTGRAIGRAVHALVLEGVRDFVVWDGDRRGKPWQEFKDAHPDATILRASEAAEVDAMAFAVLKHPAAQRVLEGQVEQSLTWTRGGLPCKGRLDVLGDGWVTDLKTCGPLRVQARTAWAQGYIHQLAWYRRGAQVDDAWIVGVEAKAPHDVGVWLVDRSAMDVADREIDAALDVLARCLESGEWPGGMPEAGVMSAPGWVLEGVADSWELEADDE